MIKIETAGIDQGVTIEREDHGAEIEMIKVEAENVMGH